MAAPVVLAAQKAAKKAGKWAAKKAGSAASKRLPKNNRSLASNPKVWLAAALLTLGPVLLSVVMFTAMLGGAAGFSEPTSEAEEVLGAAMIDLFIEASGNTRGQVVPWELLAASTLVLTDGGLLSPYPDTEKTTRVLPVLRPGIAPRDGDAKWQGGGEGVLLWNTHHPAAPDNPQDTSDSVERWAFVLEDAALAYLEDNDITVESLREAGVLDEGGKLWTQILDSLIEVRYACDANNLPAPILIPTTTTTSPTTVVDSEVAETTSTAAITTTTTAPTTVPAPMTVPASEFEPVLVWMKPCPSAIEVDPDGPAQYGQPTTTTTPGSQDSDSTSTTATSSPDAEPTTTTTGPDVCLSGCEPPTLLAPAPARPVGAQIVSKASWMIGVGDGLTGFVEGAFVGVDPTAAAAYRQAASAALAEFEACNIDVYLIAGIGKVESNHGSHGGAVIDPNGDVAPPIRNDHSTAAGPMQFLDGTWAESGVDANGDGVKDRDNYFDSATATALYLCKFLPEGVDARSDVGQRAMMKWYNSTLGYYEKVIQAANMMRSQDMQAGAGFAFSGDIGPPVATGFNAGALTRKCGPGAARLAAKPGGIIMPCHLRSVVFQVYAVPNAVGGRSRVSQVAAPYAAAMFQAAGAAGIPLGGGGYRDAAGQLAVRRNNCGHSYEAIYLWPARRCSPPTARPGTSMHETGEALDLTCAGSIIHNRTTNVCYLWLDQNAHFFGYYNLNSEPWHFSSTAG